MKILLYFGAVSLLSGAGGAKKVFCDMANAFASRNHNVFAVCNEYRTGHPFYPLDERVHFINLDGSGKRKIRPLSLIKGIRPILTPFCKAMLEHYIEEPLNKKKGEPLVQHIEKIKPDIVIPYFADDYFSILRKPMLDVPVILMHHNSAEVFAEWVNTPRKIEKINTCPHLQVLLPSFVEVIQKIYSGSVHVIPNVVPQLQKQDCADMNTEKLQRTIMMISRLQQEKQQHLLIESFGQLAHDYPHWKLKIYGAPSKLPYLRRLKKMIADLGLEEQVTLEGNTDKPLDILRNADIFAFPSASEGFPLALTEAMTMGVPCIGLKTTPSVSELIVDGVNGLLADNTSEDFAEKLKTLMDDQQYRIKLGRAGHEMMKQYAPEQIWDQWEHLIEEVIQHPRSGHIV